MTLPGENEPLVLADGTKIDPATGRVLKDKPKRTFTEVPTHREAQRQVTAVRRRLEELPAPPKQMNAISVVLSYSMYGLSDEDIALATGLTKQQVGTLKMSDAFTKMRDAVIEGMIESDKDDVRALISAHAKNAASRVVELLDSEDEKIALKAAADLLDRGGHRPADIVEHRHKMESGLVIEFVHKREGDDAITIDVTPEDDE